MTNLKPWQNGDHLVICDSCGAQRYRSQCKYTWDGYLMCTVRNCWYPKHAIFEVPPVVNDPATIMDVRPDVDATYVSDIDQVGLITTIGDTGFIIGSTGVTLGEIDSPPDYWN